MHMSLRQGIFPAIVAVVGMMAVGGSQIAAAKPVHHDAKQMLAGNVRADGHHDIDQRGKFTTSVEVRNGKVAEVHVTHSVRGPVTVKKYKTHHKMAQVAGPHVVRASFAYGQDEDLGTVYIGYAYIDDDGNEEIYWFPEEMILDGDTGAIEYVPTS